MPQKSGKEAYDIIRVINPGIKVIFTSGYSAQHLSGVIDGDVEFIPKPVMPNELLNKIRAVLDK